MKKFYDCYPDLVSDYGISVSDMVFGGVDMGASFPDFRLNFRIYFATIPSCTHAISTHDY